MGGSEGWKDSPCVTTTYSHPGCALHKWTGWGRTTHSGVSLLPCSSYRVDPPLLTLPGAGPPSQPHGGMGGVGWKLVLSWRDTEQGEVEGKKKTEDGQRGPSVFKIQFLGYLLHAALPDFPQEWGGHPPWPGLTCSAQMHLVWGLYSHLSGRSDFKGL